MGKPIKIKEKLRNPRKQPLRNLLKKGLASYYSYSKKGCTYPSKECDFLMKKTEGRLQPAGVVEQEGNKYAMDAKRTNGLVYLQFRVFREELRGGFFDLSQLLFRELSVNFFGRCLDKNTQSRGR